MRACSAKQALERPEQGEQTGVPTESRMHGPRLSCRTLSCDRLWLLPLAARAGAEATPLSSFARLAAPDMVRLNACRERASCSRAQQSAAEQRTAARCAAWRAAARWAMNPRLRAGPVAAPARQRGAALMRARRQASSAAAQRSGPPPLLPPALPFAAAARRALLITPPAHVCLPSSQAELCVCYTL
jgi:hypothetical protein